MSDAVGLNLERGRPPTTPPNASSSNSLMGLPDAWLEGPGFGSDGRFPAGPQTRSKGGRADTSCHSAMLTPEPPISFGTSFSFGNPSFIRSFVS